MSWTKEEIEILINAYKCQPCLYAAKHTMYRNRHARKQALLEVANVLKAAGKTVSSLDIKSKFNNLRANFMTQHKKYVASRNSIIGEISKPNLWYYERMTFLLDHIIPKERKNSSEQTSSISHADDLLLSTDTTQYPQEPKDFLQSSNEGMLLNDEATEEQSIYKIRISSITTLKQPDHDFTSNQIEQGNSILNINSQQDIPESPIINGKDFARLGTNSRSVTTPTLTNSINIDRKRKISELGDSQSMVDVNTTLKDIKNAIVECSTKRRGINDIFGEFVAAQLDFFEKEDSEIYNGLQEEISSIIWGARRKLFHLKEQCM